jgi:hypothetical protein
MLKDITNTKRKVRRDETKFKTEMCRNWLELGACGYGKKCNYAHGKVEILDKLPANEKYKSKDCLPFHEKGYCTYG